MTVPVQFGLISNIPLSKYYGSMLRGTLNKPPMVRGSQQQNEALYYADLCTNALQRDAQPGEKSRVGITLDVESGRPMGYIHGPNQAVEDRYYDLLRGNLTPDVFSKVVKEPFMPIASFDTPSVAASVAETRYDGTEACGYVRDVPRIPEEKRVGLSLGLVPQIAALLPLE